MRVDMAIASLMRKALPLLVLIGAAEAGGREPTVRMPEVEVRRLATKLASSERPSVKTAAICELAARAPGALLVQATSASPRDIQVLLGHVRRLIGYADWLGEVGTTAAGCLAAEYVRRLSPEERSAVLRR